jgi:hypothetical protein
VLIYVAVQFSANGKEYIYSSPVQLKRGQLVLINTYGKLTVATVSRRYKKNPTPHLAIHPIVGVAWMLEELQAPEAPDVMPESSGFVSNIMKSLIGD